MEENKLNDEGQMDQVSEFTINNNEINLECSNLPVNTVKVQGWLSGQVVDTEQGENKLPEIMFQDINQTYVKEIDNSIESVDEFLPLPPSEWSGDTDASGSSNVTELDHGDPEILVNRQKTAPSTDSIADQNSECDRQYLYIMCEGIHKAVREVQSEKEFDKQMMRQVMQNQNDMQNQSKLIMQVVENLSVGFKTGMTEIKNHIQSEMTKGKFEINENLLTMESNMQKLQSDVLLAQEGLKGDINKIQTEVTEIKGDVQNEVQIGITQIKNDFKIELTQIEVKHKEDMDRLFNQGDGIATNIIAGMKNLDGRVQAVGQDLSTVRGEIEFLREFIQKLEGDTNRELQEQRHKLVLMTERVDFLQSQLEEARKELQGYTSHNSVLVGDLENQVGTLNATIEEIRHLYHECQVGINNLEGVVEANSTQSNVLNNHLHEIDSKIQGVDGLPEMLQQTLVKVLNDTSNYPKGPPQPVSTNGPVTSILPDTNNIPSIPSSPLLANSFLTPPSVAHPPIHDPLGAIPRNRNLRSDHVIADIVKREQKPSFNGDNISPPIFLQEVESFFELIQITEDRDRVQLFPTFLVTNPFE